MSTIVQVKSSDSSHWYLRDGTPFYETPQKCVVCKGKGWNGRGHEPCDRCGSSGFDGIRPVTLRDARKIGAVPSVTGVLGVIEKKALTNWKIEQGIISALTLPRLDGEDDHSFARRVAEDAMSVSREAADFGSRVHGAIETVIHEPKNWPGMVDEDLQIYALGFSLWYEENLDKLTNCIVDWKTQAKQKGKPFDFWEDWCWQLAAYRYGLFTHVDPAGIRGNLLEVPFASCSGFGGRVDYVNFRFGKPRLVSVAISSLEPGQIEMKVWTEAEAERGWEIFQAALTLWRLTRKYDPRTWKETNE